MGQHACLRSCQCPDTQDFLGSLNDMYSDLLREVEQVRREYSHRTDQISGNSRYPYWLFGTPACQDIDKGTRITEQASRCAPRYRSEIAHPRTY
jgi:hypothetical protein